MVMRRGYRLGERLLRPALVAVADPEEPTADAPAGAADQGSGDGQGDGASEK